MDDVAARSGCVLPGSQVRIGATRATALSCHVVPARAEGLGLSENRSRIVCVCESSVPGPRPITRDHSPLLEVDAPSDANCCKCCRWADLTGDGFPLLDQCSGRPVNVCAEPRAQRHWCIRTLPAHSPRPLGLRQVVSPQLIAALWGPDSEAMPHGQGSRCAGHMAATGGRALPSHL
jgi:hypothetical protein